jgi:hypothetical protein
LLLRPLSLRGLRWLLPLLLLQQQRGLLQLLLLQLVRVVLPLQTVRASTACVRACGRHLTSATMGVPPCLGLLLLLLLLLAAACLVQLPVSLQTLPLMPAAHRLLLVPVLLQTRPLLSAALAASGRNGPPWLEALAA